MFAASADGSPFTIFLHDQIIAGTNPYQEFKLFKLNEEDLS